MISAYHSPGIAVFWRIHLTIAELYSNKFNLNLAFQTVAAAEGVGVKDFLKRIIALKHRKYKRFEAQEGLTVAVDPASFPGDQIVNIGLGGLTFNWIDGGKPLPVRFKIDLFRDGKLYLEKLKVKLVTNIEVGDISYSSKNIRRISVQFLSLTPVQEFDVKALIKSHGIEEI